jgi:hypothetical protein
MNFLLNVNAKGGSEDILKQAIGKEGLVGICNDNGVLVVNFGTSINLTAKSTMFQNSNIHKFT